jgi:hypothetical protein
MTVPRFFSIILILGCTTIAWVILGKALDFRTDRAQLELTGTVMQNIGQPMLQKHPVAYYVAPTSARKQRTIEPISSKIAVDLQFDKRKKGLIWYRTFVVDFAGTYVLKNPTPITQTIYISFALPCEKTRYDSFQLKIGDRLSDKSPAQCVLSESVILDAGAEVPLEITYQATGLDHWIYSFEGHGRVRNFDLAMTTNFRDYDIPANTESPLPPEETDDGMRFTWKYTDVINAKGIGMDMPKVLNPGPVATRITFVAPISLLFFFAVLLILATVKKIDLHPMNYFFLAAGCFAFQLLFAYLVDILPVTLAFVIAAVVSLILVSGYLGLAVGFSFAKIAGLAQFAYMILFSYSFFFDGLTGITIAVGAVVTLAVLMIYTAKTDWSSIFRRSRPVPAAA